MTSTTSGHTRLAGVVPADSARTSPGAWRSKNACAICERPALWLQTNSTRFITDPLWRSRRDAPELSQLDRRMQIEVHRSVGDEHPWAYRSIDADRSSAGAQDKARQGRVVLRAGRLSRRRA